MKQTKIKSLAIAFLVFCFLKPAFAENNSLSNPQGVSIDFKFVCENSSSECDKFVDENTKEELFLEKTTQLSIGDIESAKAVTEEVPEFAEQQYKAESFTAEFSKSPSAAILLKFTEQAKQKLAKVTSENINRRLAIVINGKLIMAPQIFEPITGGEIKISNRDITKKYAEELVTRINSLAEHQGSKLN